MTTAKSYRVVFWSGRRHGSANNRLRGREHRTQRSRPEGAAKVRRDILSNTVLADGDPEMARSYTSRWLRRYSAVAATRRCTHTSTMRLVPCKRVEHSLDEVV